MFSVKIWLEVFSRNTAHRRIRQSQFKKFYICGMDRTSFDIDVTTAVAGNQI